MLKKEQQLLKKGLLVGVGLAAYAQEKARKVAKELIRTKQIDQAEGKRLVKTICQETDKSRKRITNVVESELKRLLKITKPKKKPKRKKKKR